MQISILKTADVPELPNDVTLVADWGECMIRTTTTDKKTGKVTEGWDRGEHILVEAEEQAIRRWLGALDGVYVCTGSPMLQHFEMMHIKEEEAEPEPRWEDPTYRAFVEDGIIKGDDDADLPL